MKALSLIALVLIQVAVACVHAAPTALDRYVAKRDLNYRFYRYHTESKPLYTTYFLRLTSQQWRTVDQVDQVVWQHDLMMTVPRLLAANCRDTALLIIDGGSNGGLPPRDTNTQVANLATAFGCAVVLLKQVPNQPLVFAHEEPRKRSEDGILAYSFDKFLDTGDEEWPAHLPMTKAVVRAMDATQTALATRSIRISRFILYGGSKRGWTAWLTAAVDRRVRAIVPASADLLNLGTQSRHHCEAYGFYTKAIEDYAAFDIPNRAQTPEGAALAAIVDPISYRSRLTMPKLIMNSAGDQYFPPDSSQFYFADLPAPKWLRYAPNTDHAQNGVLLSAVAWIKRILDGKSTPQFSWTFDPTGAIRVQTVTKPSQVRLWQATNPRARDFRLETIGKTWVSTPLYDWGGGQYVGYIPPPKSGWSAFLVELTFKSSSLLEPDQVYTTDVRVTPDVLPFEGKHCSFENSGTE